MLEESSVRLFCLPYAGASAAVYLPWRQSLQPHIAVTPLELPGRGGRMHEPPRHRLEPLLHDLVPHVVRLCDRPFALFGHGFGAVLAFEIAARLEWDHELVAERLYVSGYPAPHRPRPEPPRGHLPDGAPQPVLRAELALAASYEEGFDTSVHAPITAMAGREDPTLRGAELEKWRGYTRRCFRVRRFPGGHVHWAPDERPLLETIADDLTRRYAAHRRFALAERTF